MDIHHPATCRIIWSAVLGGTLVASAFSTELAVAEEASSPELTRVSAVRELTPDHADLRLPVRLRGVVTFFFNGRSFFVQDESAGIFVGADAELPLLHPGDLVSIEGVSSSGEYAPIVRASKLAVLGRTNMPLPKAVSFEDLMTGREDSQWVEVSGLVRAVYGDPAAGQTVEIASGGGRLTAFLSPSIQSNLVGSVDSRLRVRGVCGTWFNKVRQLFGVRLVVPRSEDIIIEELPSTNVLSQPAIPIGELLRFAPHASYGHRVKVAATVVLQQPGRALFVQDDRHGLYVRTRQLGALHPGDRVELIGFPDTGEYTPTLQNAVWIRRESGPEPEAASVGPDEALAGLHDSRLVGIEGRLLDHTRSGRETLLVLEAAGRIFSAQLDSPDLGGALSALQNHSRLRVSGVCRIEVGEEWSALPEWRAKSFRILMRSPADVQVLSLPPWWTLTKLLWAVGILAGFVLASLGWVTLLHRKVQQQTSIISQKLELEGSLKERYRDLFESANDMVYTHDLGGRITSINVAGEQLLGQSRANVINKHLLDFIVEEQRPAARRWLEDIADGEAPATVEWDFLTASGERLRLETSTRLIDHEGREVEVEGIARDVTERRRLEKEILEASTREQRRIGHDLHDGVCQQLAGIAVLSDILAEKLEEQACPEAGEAHRITDLVDQASNQTRAVARGLFPVRLEENGLVSALEELARNAAAFYQTRCDFVCESPVVLRDHSAAHHLYFIAQESILNAVRHGRATWIEVRLEPAAGNQGCTLTVRDDGVGLPSPLPPGPGMGIRIMKYRARIIGATVVIHSLPAGGAEVTCQFSVREPNHSEVSP